MSGFIKFNNSGFKTNYQIGFFKLNQTPIETVKLMNVAQLSLKEIANGKSPKELLEWLGRAITEVEYLDFRDFDISHEEMKAFLNGSSKIKCVNYPPSSFIEEYSDDDVKFDNYQGW